MRRPTQRNRAMSEINITPLTDVMMVLLVIFMVTTPLIMKASIDINLPQAHVKKAATVEQVRIMVTREGRIYLDQKVVELVNLESELRAVLAERGGDKMVTVSADKQVLYGEAVKVLDIARQAGAQKLMLAAEPLPVKPLSEEILSQ